MGVAFLQQTEDSVPGLCRALDDTRNDQPFIANTLLNMATAVDMELTEEYQGFVRSLERRVSVPYSRAVPVPSL